MPKLFLALLVAAQPALAAAQPARADAGRTSVQQAPASASGAASPQARTDAAAQYDAAMALLTAGKLEEAAVAFDAVARLPDAGPLADRARTLAEVSRSLAARGRFVLEAPKLERPRPARLDRSGRAELAFYSTAYGIWTGVATGILAGADDARAYLGLAIAGGAGGLALAILPTRHASMPEGRAQAIEAAGTWGSLNGGLLAGVSGAGTKGVVGATLGTGLASMAAAVVSTRDHYPSSGDVALVNSGGIWGLVAGGLTVAILDDASSKTTQGVLLAGTDAGLLAMGLLTRKVEVSRGRSLLIDAGGLLGTLVGASIPAFANAENGPAIGASGLGGMAAGLALGAWLTRDWDADAERASAEPKVTGRVTVPMVARLDHDGFAAGVAGKF